MSEGEKLDDSWQSGRATLSKVINKSDKTAPINSVCQHLHLEVIWIFAVTLAGVQPAQCSSDNAL